MFIGKFRRLGTRYKGLFIAANIFLDLHNSSDDTKAEFSNCYFYRTSKQIADFSYTQNPASRVMDIQSLESKQSPLF